ncbi:hypothetical protein GXW77_04535 [Roseomonas alkaliterrae]|jgi:hypothetical protein|uniref:Pam3-gp28 family putative phage holin n=1 Tax=Neoroseomonas alkaliterrae TaxID=1452450 RepID=UPI001BACAE22|nr:hypothetical protein [Neoroseomonas alkaliterrae]MBR0675437.1 hypothetical protein [Neoroseomonas alkaliterrae]
MSDAAAATSAALPVVRQIVQHLAGVVLGAGAITENEAAVVAGAIVAVANLAWMLVARAKAQKAGP